MSPDTVRGLISRAISAVIVCLALGAMVLIDRGYPHYGAVLLTGVVVLALIELTWWPT